VVPGDMVTVDVAGLGKLTNTVAEVGVLTRLLELSQPVPKKRSPPP